MCGTALKVRTGYFGVVIAAALVVSTLLAYAAGLRGGVLAVVALLGALPAEVILAFVSLRLFALELELAGDVQSILYGNDAVDAAPAADDHRAVDVAPVAAAPPAPTGTRAMSRLNLLVELFRSWNEPRSFEGYLVQVVAVVVVVSAVWMAAEPVLRSVFPGFEATRTGPRGFPVVVHVGPATLSVTNQSDANWACRAELGSEHLPYNFTVAAGATRDLRYDAFDPAGLVDTSAIRAAARRLVRLTCDEPSGISHTGDIR